MKKHFTEKDLWMANKDIKRCSECLVTREMQMQIKSIITTKVSSSVRAAKQTTQTGWLHFKTTNIYFSWF